MITTNQIYNYIEEVVNTSSRPVYTTSRDEPITEHFPACQIKLLDQVDDQRALPLSFATKAHVSSRVNFEVHVYSNKKNTALSEAREIMDDVELAFRQLSFIKIARLQMESINSTIVHLVARFTRNIADGDELQN